MPSSRHLLTAAVTALLSATSAAQTVVTDPAPAAPVAGASCHGAIPFGQQCYQTVDAAFAAFERVRGGYNTGEERLMRKNAFHTSANVVTTFNTAPDAGYTLAINPTSDLTDAEFKSRYLGLKMSDTPPMVLAMPFVPDATVPAPTTDTDTDTGGRRLRTFGAAVGATHKQSHAAAAPAEGRQLQTLTAVDWVAAGKVNPVKDQGQCGSCWSFATMASVETNAAIAGLPLTPLSEQLLVDCNTANSGCNGGDMVQAFSWLIQRGGACTSASYPYKAVRGACSNSCASVVKLSSYTKPTTTDAGLSAAAVKGAVAVAIQADSNVFRYYSSGVLDSSTCGTNLNHGVTVVGQGTDSTTGKGFFKIRNSWGTGWGESGYVRMAYGKNTCGITMYLSQPVIDASFNPSGGTAPSASVTPTRSATASPSRSAASASRTASASATRSVAASSTASASSSAAPSTSATATATSSAAPSTSATATATRSVAPSASSSMTASATATATRSGSSGASATGTASHSAMPSATASASGTATRSGSSGASATGTASNSALPSATASASATATRSGSSGASATGTASNSAAASMSGTVTASATATASHSASASASATAAAAPGGASGIHSTPAADPANNGGSADGLVPVTPGGGASQPSTTGTKLSGGAIAGIVAGALAGAALIALAVLAANRASRVRKAAAPEAAAPPAPPTPAPSPAAAGIAV